MALSFLPVLKSNWFIVSYGKEADLILSRRANATAQVNQTFRLKCPIASVTRTCPLIQHGGQFHADLPLDGA